MQILWQRFHTEMRLYLANTDYDWYRHLLGLAREPGGLDEANFWRPSGSQVVGYLSFGDPFVFKLKSAHRHVVVGFGYWVAFVRLSVQEAWATFGEKNGATTIETMWGRVARYAFRNVAARYDPRHSIGCDLIASPVFFPKEMWIQGPRDWKPNIVTGSGNYDTREGEGARIWRACLERAALLGPDLPIIPERVTEPAGRFGAEQVIRPRLGQGTFRFALQQTYRKCAVTREHSLPALDAAHIIPYGQGGTHELPNGLLLRADIHKLFDSGYVSVTPDYRFRVSPQLEYEFHNGKVYYEHENTPLWLPERPEDRPDPVRLERHYEEVFRRG